MFIRKNKVNYWNCCKSKIGFEQLIYVQRGCHKQLRQTVKAITIVIIRQLQMCKTYEWLQKVDKVFKN